MNETTVAEAVRWNGLRGFMAWGCEGADPRGPDDSIPQAGGNQGLFPDGQTRPQNPPGVPPAVRKGVGAHCVPLHGLPLSPASEPPPPRRGAVRRAGSGGLQFSIPDAGTDPGSSACRTRWHPTRSRAHLRPRPKPRNDWPHALEEGTRRRLYWRPSGDLRRIRRTDPPGRSCQAIK